MTTEALPNPEEPEITEREISLDLGVVQAEVARHFTLPDDVIPREWEDGSFGDPRVEPSQHDR